MLIPQPLLIFWPSVSALELDHGPTGDGIGDSYTYEVATTESGIALRHVEHWFFTETPEGSSRTSKLSLLGSPPTVRQDAIDAVNNAPTGKYKVYNWRVSHRLDSISGSSLPSTTGGTVLEVKNATGAVFARCLRQGDDGDWSKDQTFTEYWLAIDGPEVGASYDVFEPTAAPSGLTPKEFGDNFSSSPTHLSGATLLFRVDCEYRAFAPKEADIFADPT